MAKKVTALLACLVCVGFLAAGELTAGDSKMYLGFYGLWAGEQIDVDQTKRKFTGPINVDFDDSWGVQGRFGYKLSDLLTAEALFEYITPFEAIGGANSDELDVKHLSFNAKVTCPAYKVWVPYFIAGLGVMNAHEDIHFNGRRSETSNWGTALRGGLGVDWYIDPKISLGLEGAYALGMGGVSHIEYTTIALGVAYHF